MPRQPSPSTLLAIAIALAAPLRAGAQVEAPAPAEFCFRQAAATLCRMFLIAEMGVAGPLTKPERLVTIQSGGSPAIPDEERIFHVTVEWSAGLMQNVSESWALGGMIRLGSGASSPFRGALVRARRWGGRGYGLDVQAGLLRQEAGGGWLSRDANGVTASVRVAQADRGYLGLRGDFIHVGEVREQYNGRNAYAEAGSFFTLMPEVGVTGKPMVAVMGAGAAMFLLFMVSCAATDCMS